MAFSIRKFFSRKSLEDKPTLVRRGFSYRGGTVVNSDTAMQVSAYHRGLTYISTQIAKLPWEVKDADNNFVNNAVSNLLCLAPNEEMNAFMFRLCMIQNAINHGNGYAEIERSTVGTPLALWPLQSQDVELVRTPSGRLAYKCRSGAGGKEVFLPPKDVFHVRNFHTKDGLLGQGIIAYAIETLGISLAADQLASGLFHNGGLPSGVLSHPGTLSDGAYERLKQSWAEQHSGRKAGGTSILEEGTKYESINMPPEALQFLQSRQFSVLEIARFLGIPPTKFFDVTAATFSNVENSNLEVATDTLDAWAVNLEMEADIKILNNRYGGRFTELDLYSVFRGDMTTRANYFKSMMSIGAVTPNQIRAREGLAPYTEGDNYYIATNNFTPVDRMDEVIDSQIAKNKNPSSTPAKDVTPPADGGGDTGTNNELKKAAVKFLLSK